MAFNNFNNPRQVFPTQNRANFSVMQASGHAPMAGFQPNLPHGPQGFPPQQNQAFPSYRSPMGPQMGQPRVNQMDPQLGSQIQQMGPQMRPPVQMVPRVNLQMGLQIGALPPNVQLGHQFPKQQQKIMEQQRKRFEEQLKKEEELMKKKQLEAEKRKLQQSFIDRKPTNANALNSLFGKSSKGGGSPMSNLLGSLGSDSNVKPATSISSNVFSRPGGSTAHHSSITAGQWGTGYMTTQGSPAASSLKQLHCHEEDFSEFTQGPSVADQENFGHFQGSQPSLSQFGGSGISSMGASAVVANTGGSTNSLSHPLSCTPAVLTSSSSTGTQHSFSGTQSTPVTSSNHGIQKQNHVASSVVSSSSAPWAGPSSAIIIQGGQVTQFPAETSNPQTGSTPILPLQGIQLRQATGDVSRPRTGSFPGTNVQGGQLAQTSVNTITSKTGSMFEISSQLGQMAQFTQGTLRQNFGSMPGQGDHMPNPVNEVMKNRSGSMSEMIHTGTGSAPGRLTMSQPVRSYHGISLGTQDGGAVPVGVLHPAMSPQVGGFGVMQSHHGTLSVPSQEQPNAQQGLDQGRFSAAPFQPALESDAEVEDSPERKLELLYGVKLPDWCVNGTDLPGVYREIQEKTSDASDTIDTNRLFPILMASDLPRDQLGHIWSKANRAIAGQLNTLELRIVLGLIALAQAGMKTERLTLEKLASCMAAPIPTIPEHVLQTKEHGWSFAETPQGISQKKTKMEGDTVSEHHSSASSDLSVDPNDRYSVFRTVKQPETNEAASVFTEKTEDSFGAFKSSNPPVSKPGTITSHFPLLRDGLSLPTNNSNQAEVNVLGGSNMTNPQSSFGNFQTVAAQGTSQEFSGFQEQTVLNSNSRPSTVGQNPSQDEFGDFQSQTALHGNTFSLTNQTFNQVKVPEVNLVRTGIDDWSGRANPPFKLPHVGGVLSQVDNFGDFQGRKDPEDKSKTSAANNEGQTRDQVKPLQGFDSFIMGNESSNKTKSSDIAGLDLFTKAVNNAHAKLDENVSSKSFAGTDDFGDFQHSPGPLSSVAKGFSSFDSSTSEKPALSLGMFKLSNEWSSEKDIKPMSIEDKKSSGTSLTTETHSSDENQKNTFADFSAFQSNTSQPSNQVETSGDRYSAFRALDFGSGGSLFSASNPATTEDQTTDDEFADFGGFEVSNQIKSSKESDFGGFKSTEDVQNLSVTSGMAGNSQTAEEDLNQDFGDFSTFESFDARTPQPESDLNSSNKFGAFDSFVTGSTSAVNKCQPNLTSKASDSLINAVSLEPTERYKFLSHESGDMDQHAHAWSRCLNSCLLTLATATLAIQKIAEQSVKEEVLESKQGTTYFSAIVEIYRVTLRIKASINKSAPNNKKLQDIQQEINRTWKGISAFLSGSNILPSQTSMDFSLHHVTASEDGSVACGICLLNVDKVTSGSSKNGDGKLTYGGRQYHSTCANFWCNRVDSVLPSLLPNDSLI